MMLELSREIGWDLNDTKLERVGPQKLCWRPWIDQFDLQPMRVDQTLGCYQMRVDSYYSLFYLLLNFWCTYFSLC